VRINNINNPQGIQRPAEARLAARTKEQLRRGKDAFEPSDIAKDFNVARRGLSALPDVRAEKVASIIAKINSGEYDVTAWDIAAKLVDART
jgi:flagellar biosynthesis anti-sigma factor FlgM